MIRSYFKIAYRNLSRNKVYSFINIGGLSLGMTVAMLIGFWVYDEVSFDRYHQNYESVGQFMKAGVDEDGTPWAGGFSLAFPLIDELRTNYGANFTHIVEALQPSEFILTAGDTKISGIGQFMASGAPHMLTLDMIAGTRNGLNEPQSILLSESMARSLFGDIQPLGHTLNVNADIDVTVTGIFRDIPNNTKFHSLKFILPFELAKIKHKWVTDPDWQNHFLHIYYQTAPDKTYEQVASNVESSLKKAIQNTQGLEGLKKQEPKIVMVPMKDWHLRSTFSWPNYGKPDAGPARLVWLVGIIGGFVLILACINFMNLSTARSEKRAREVGIRKSMGSFRHQLVGQFFAESYLIVLMAFTVSILLTYLTLPSFNQLAAKNVSVPWSNPLFWMFVGFFVVVTGLLAGSYPALYLSSFNPVKTLKGTFRTGRLASVPRKILVVVQFTVSVTLIISTIVIYNQIIFAKQRPVGYTREGLILIPKKNRDFWGKTEVLRSELKKTGMVEEIAESGGKVTNVWSNNSGFSWEGKDPELKENFGTLAVTAEYGSAVHWQFVEGRDFSPDKGSDSSALVINESAMKFMGLKNIIGQSIRWKNKNWRTDKDFHIVGVVKDMVMDSPYEPAKPTVFLLRKELSWLNIRLRDNVKTSEALTAVGSVFKKIVPSAPFDYEFADSAYAAKFAAEERIASLASVFAVLAILISCLGLFGLASFVAEQRTKEIGIRKVVGASVFNLWKMLSADFVTLVMISSLLAVPVTHYALSAWLQQYKYRIEISPWVFVLCIGGAVVITLITVSYQALKAARMSPVKSLKNE